MVSSRSKKCRSPVTAYRSISSHFQPWLYHTYLTVQRYSKPCKLQQMPRQCLPVPVCRYISQNASKWRQNCTVRAPHCRWIMFPENDVASLSADTVRKDRLPITSFDIQGGCGLYPLKNGGEINQQVYFSLPFYGVFTHMLFSFVNLKCSCSCTPITSLVLTSPKICSISTEPRTVTKSRVWHLGPGWIRLFGRG